MTFATALSGTTGLGIESDDITTSVKQLVSSRCRSSSVRTCMQSVAMASDSPPPTCTVCPLATQGQTFFNVAPGVGTTYIRQHAGGGGGQGNGDDEFRTFMVADRHSLFGAWLALLASGFGPGRGHGVACRLRLVQMEHPRSRSVRNGIPPWWFLRPESFVCCFAHCLGHLPSSLLLIWPMQQQRIQRRRRQQQPLPLPKSQRP